MLTDNTISKITVYTQSNYNDNHKNIVLFNGCHSGRVRKRRNLQDGLLWRCIHWECGRILDPSDTYSKKENIL